MQAVKDLPGTSNLTQGRNKDASKSEHTPITGMPNSYYAHLRRLEQRIATLERTNGDLRRDVWRVEQKLRQMLKQPAFNPGESQNVSSNGVNPGIFG